MSVPGLVPLKKKTFGQRFRDILEIVNTVRERVSLNYDSDYEEDMTYTKNVH